LAHILVKICFGLYGDFIPQTTYRGFALDPTGDSVPQTTLQLWTPRLKLPALYTGIKKKWLNILYKFVLSYYAPKWKFMEIKFCGI